MITISLGLLGSAPLFLRSNSRQLLLSVRFRLSAQKTPLIGNMGMEHLLLKYRLSRRAANKANMQIG